MSTYSSRLLATIATLVALAGCDTASTTPTTPTDGDSDPAVATTITLSTSQLNFASLGESQTITATVKDQRGQGMAGATVSWASSDVAVATVDAAGRVTSLKVGTAILAATSGSLADSAAISVTQVPASLTLSDTRLAFDAVGETESLGATVLDARENPISGGTVTWASSNEAVATVDPSGMVRSMGAGTAVVTASVASLSATSGVTVNLWSPQDAQVIAAIQGPLRNAPDSYIVQWALTDFDRDGNDDVALSSWTACGGQVGCGTGGVRNPAAPLRLFRRASDGSMEDVSAELLEGEVTAYTNVPVATDLNNDGVSDLFLAGFTDDPPERGPSKILLSGGGGYTVREDATLVWAHGSGAFDLNGDGCQDILVGDNVAPIWRGDCSGNFTRLIYGGPNPVPLTGATGLEVDGPGWGMGMCVGDFNGDGSMDVVYTDAIVRTTGEKAKSPQNNVILDVDWTQAAPTIRAVHALPIPVLDRGSSVGTEKSHDMRCIVADLDRDGDDDIFISSTVWPDDNVSWGGSQFQVYLNQGNWTFTDVSDTAFQNRSTDWAFGFNPILRDLNGDGVPDLIFSGRAYEGSIPLNPVWLGNGDGSFRQSTRVNMGELRRQAADLVNAYANLPAWAHHLAVDEIAPVRRATGEYDFLVTHVATDNVAVPGSPHGVPTIYVVFIPLGVRF